MKNKCEGAYTIRAGGGQSIYYKRETDIYFHHYSAIPYNTIGVEHIL